MDNKFGSSWNGNWRILKNNTFAVHVISILINGGFLYVLTFANSILIARTLGPKGQGIISYANTISGIFIHFGGFGLDLAGKYYVAKDKNNLAGAIGNAVLFFLAYMALGLITLLFIGLCHIQVDLPFIVVALAICRAPVGIVSSQLQNILLGLSNVKIYNRTRLISGLLYPASVFILTISGGISPSAVLLAAFFANVAAVVSMFVPLMKVSGMRVGVDFRLLKKMFPYGIKQYIGAMFNYFLLRCDILMIKYFRGDQETGIYSLATSLADVLLMVTSSVALVLTTKLIELPGDSRRFAFENKVLRYVSLIMAAVTAAAAFISGWGINLIYGSAYHASVIVFKLLMPGIFFWGLNSVISSYLSAVNKLNITILASGAAFLVNIILNYFFIPVFGIAGAGVVSSVAYFIDMGVRALYYKYLYRCGGEKWSD